MDTDVRTHKGTTYVATTIDDTFLDIITKRLFNIISHFDASLPEQFRPEFSCMIELIFYIVSLNKLATPGMATFGLKFDASRNDKSIVVTRIVLCVYILFKWLLARFELTALLQRWRSLPDNNIRKRIWKYCQVIDFVTRIANISNQLCFFQSGLYPLLVYRLCSLKIHKPPSVDNVNSGMNENAGVNNLELQYKHRRLLGAAISALSTMGYQYIRSNVNSNNVNNILTYFQKHSLDFLHFIEADVGNTVKRIKCRVETLAGYSPVSKNETDSPLNKENNNSNNYDNIIKETILHSKTSYSARHVCVLCERSPVEDPYITNCGHIYCYVCIYFTLISIPGMDQYFCGNVNKRLNVVDPNACKCHKCEEYILYVHRMMNTDSKET